MRFLRKIKAQSTEVSLLQDNIVNVLNPIAKTVIIDGALLEVDVDTGSNKINHMLSRAPLGWCLAGMDAAITVYETASSTTILTLECSGPATIKLWVF